MKKLQVIVFAAVLAAGLTLGAAAREAAGSPKAAKPGAIAVDVITWSATVKGVDYEKKTVVLEDDKGMKIEVNAKNARNLDRVLVGDKVKVRYIEELAVYVRKSGAPATDKVVQTVALAPKGSMPGGVVAETVQIQADVEGVNYRNRTVTLKGIDGETRTYKVGKNVNRLKEIRKGDQVVVNVTQALALEVVKP
jgi:Cu/Ag efflux protein CusF